MPDSLSIHLRFAFSTSSNSDTRTLQVYSQEAGQETELYKFYHPVTGLSIGLTTVQRRNPNTEIYETACEIEWKNETNATVSFGVEQVALRDLRKPKKSSSQSRRFKAGGSEYKWKIAENNKDLFCVDTRGKTLAEWNEEQQSLKVARRLEGVLDRVVVTCFLNLWMKRMGDW
ncbi:hypothetical protein EV121DRAFT_289234 [Schizophyllum commune]